MEILGFWIYMSVVTVLLFIEKQERREEKKYDEYIKKRAEEIKRDKDNVV